MTHKSRKGFTLIEIVIVLAIAALILVVIFFAVQGAQRGQRNEQRKDFAARALSKYQEYQGNNNGTAPTSAQLDATFGAGERGAIGGTNLTAEVNAASLGACGGGGTVARVVSTAPVRGQICLETATTGQLYQTSTP